MQKFCSYVTLLFCGMLTAGQAQAASSICDSVAGNLVENCGFETGDFSMWSVTGNLQGGINGNYIGVDTENPNSGSYQAYLGAQSANQQTGSGDLYGPVTALSQAIATANDHLYKIGFSLDTNGCSVSDGDCPGYHNYFDVYLNGHQVFASRDIPNSGGLYTSYNFVAASIEGTSHDIQFDFANDSDVFFFDDVSVVDLGPGAQTPEPASVWLMASATALCAFTWRPRKRVLSEHLSGTDDRPPKQR